MQYACNIFVYIQRESRILHDTYIHPRKFSSKNADPIVINRLVLASSICKTVPSTCDLRTLISQPLCTSAWRRCNSIFVRVMISLVRPNALVKSVW